jgi:hypothetical protein
MDWSGISTNTLVMALPVGGSESLRKRIMSPRFTGKLVHTPLKKGISPELKSLKIREQKEE